MTLVLRSTGQIYYRMYFYWYMSDAFLMTRLGLWVFQRKIKKKNAIFITNIKSFIPPGRVHKLFRNVLHGRLGSLSFIKVLLYFSSIPQILVYCVFIYIHLKIFSNLPFDFCLHPWVFKEVCLGISI